MSENFTSKTMLEMSQLDIETDADIAAKIKPLGSKFGAYLQDGALKSETSADTARHSRRLELERSKTIEELLLHRFRCCSRRRGRRRRAMKSLEALFERRRALAETARMGDILAARASRGDRLGRQFCRCKANHWKSARALSVI